MACGSCRECSRKVYVATTAFTDGNLVLTLPSTAAYNKGCKYCLIITTALPAGLTRNAPVVAVVGDGTTQFPLLTRCGAPVLEQQISPRRRYPVRVNTTASGGSLSVLCDLPEVDYTTLAALNDAGTATPTT